MSERISKQVFWSVIKPELLYFNKKWEGKDDAEKEHNERTVLALYYNRLNRFTQYDLEIAFNRYRDENKIFPKINQIVALLPKKSEIFEPSNHKTAPMPDSVKGKSDEWSSSPEMREKMAEMVIQRFGTQRADANRLFGVIT